MTPLEKLAAMQGPYVTLCLVFSQYGSLSPGDWTLTYEKEREDAVKLKITRPTINETIETMHTKLFTIAKVIPDVAPLAIEHQPDHPTEVPAYESTIVRDLDDEVPF